MVLVWRALRSRPRPRAYASGLAMVAGQSCIAGLQGASARFPFPRLLGAFRLDVFAHNERPSSQNEACAAHGHASRAAPAATPRAFASPCGVGIPFALAEGREHTDKKRLKYHGGILPRGQPHGRLVEPLCRVFACTSRFQVACGWRGQLPQSSATHGDSGHPAADHCSRGR